MQVRQSARESEQRVIEAIQQVRKGQMVVICDDEEREHEADLCIAAQHITPAAVNFMVHAACGLVCVALSGQRVDALRLPLAERMGEPLQGTAFTASVDARYGTSSGISAADRARTIRALIDPTTRPDELVRPGHVFPLRARPGGTLERRGHTEASVDLMLLAGLEPGAAICEILDRDGEAARGAKLQALLQEWQLPVVTVDDIARYRREHKVKVVAETHLPTARAVFRLLNYRELATWQDIHVMVLGNLAIPAGPPPLIRLHSACMTGDVFGSQRCDCQAQMQRALDMIAQEGRGALLYLPQEGRGIGLTGKLQAYMLQERGLDTIEANERLGYPVDARNYHAAIAILHDLGVTHARLLTNNPDKVLAVTQGGIAVERVPLQIAPTASSSRYLATKQERMGHWLDMSEIAVLIEPAQ
jgi:3,4-dihydroxy 2-butanone 4-phosphate synthase/GTP cyclohydrolase II